MKNALKMTAAVAAISLALGACASAPQPNQRLVSAEASLQHAKADPTTFEAGRAPLEKAEVSLQEARDFYAKGKDDAYTHSIRMGESYIALATARGDQVDANHKIVALNKDRADVVAQARAHQLAVAQAAAVDARAETAQAKVATAEAEARTTDAKIVASAAIADSAASDAARRDAEARADSLQASLASYDQKKTELGLMLILRDLQFASASAVLGSGAQGRLAPLADFLNKQPEAKIRIVGHTDSQGADAANMDLSARRAQSVGAYLVSTGVDASRITSVGMGESAPVATNDTAAGRAINRRVEVTILN